MTSIEQRVGRALSVLQGLNLTPLDLFTELTENPKWQHYLDPEVLNERFKRGLAIEIMSLTSSTKFHLNISKLTEENLENINISNMAKQMRTIAPQLWSLLGLLLSADDRLVQDRERKRKQATYPYPRPALKRTRTGSSSFDGELETPIVPPGSIPLVSEVPAVRSMVEERSQALIEVKKVACISIMMQSTNQRCNALQAMAGVFLHSCGTPETVREFIAHMGLSMSTSSINEAIKNLAHDVLARIKEQGKNALTSYAYDNLDIDLKHSMTVLEKAQDSLIHLTTATMLPVGHNVTPKDLDCADEVWKAMVQPRVNPNVRRSPPVTLEQLSNVHPEEIDESGMTRQERFRSWVFLANLVTEGPSYFQKFVKTLGDPETVDAIPITKTIQIPLSAMDVKPSSPAENGDALKKIFEQSGVGDPNDTGPDTNNPLNKVILVWGDLLTGQHLQSLLDSRSIEDTQWRQLKNVVFNMGLFHLKMACADTIFKTFIVPKDARLDKTSLMAFVALLRPKETGKIESSPGFRRMHEVIQHVGLALRLDIWRLEALAAGWQSLEEFADSKPS